MPKVGDRVIIEGAKIGQQRREGSLVGITGRLLNVRWNDGSTSLLTPGAGSVTFLPKSGKQTGSAAKKAAPAKRATAKVAKAKAIAKPGKTAKKPAAAGKKAKKK